MFSPNKTWQEKTHFFLVGLFSLVFASILFLQATKPIYDPDFWWHLKTGEMIVHEGGLLQSDPFSFHDNSENVLRERNALTGYWLWQVPVYILYDFLGLNGILLHNILINLGMAASLVWQFYRKRISMCLAAPLLLAGFWLTRYFPLERPQVFSFFFAILLVWMLLSLRRGGRLGVALPIMMCLWANVHGGFLFGSLILFCFGVGVIIEYRHDSTKMKNLLIWVFAGVAATLVNPNGGGIYLELFNFHESNLMNMVLEYQSTWTSYSQGRHLYALLWLLITIYFVAVVILRQVYWPELLIAVFLAYVSVSYTRNIPFFSLAMLPATGLLWREVFRRWRFSGSQIIGLISMSFVILMALWLAQSYWKTWQPGEKMRMFYPLESADFLERSGLQGRMFNDYSFGGYYLWRLSPEFKVFIDGRAINTKVFMDYRRIAAASLDSSGGHADYLHLLSSYKIDYIVQSIYDEKGNVQPLMMGVLAKMEWLPIYLDSKVYVLAKSSEDYKEILEKHQIDKDEFKKRLLFIYSDLQRNNPQDIRFRVARAGMLIYMGYYKAAENEVGIISTLKPDESSLPALRKGLQVLAWRRNKSPN